MTQTRENMYNDIYRPNTLQTWVLVRAQTRQIKYQSLQRQNQTCIVHEDRAVVKTKTLSYHSYMYREEFEIITDRSVPWRGQGLPMFRNPSKRPSGYINVQQSEGRKSIDYHWLPHGKAFQPHSFCVLLSASHEPTHGFPHKWRPSSIDSRAAFMMVRKPENEVPIDPSSPQLTKILKKWQASKNRQISCFSRWKSINRTVNSCLGSRMAMGRINLQP